MSESVAAGRSRSPPCSRGGTVFSDAAISVAVGHQIPESRLMHQMSRWVGSLGHGSELSRCRVHRVAISKIEAGARDITLPELAAIAGALDIAPTALLFPNVLERLEVLPGLRVIGTEALGWFTGLGNGRPGHYVDGASGDDLGLRWYTVPSRIVPEAIRLVEVEEALKYQRNVVDILEGETELPTESDIRKTVRAEQIAHARKILELLKDEWHMRVYDELLRLTGSPRTPTSLVAPLEERLEELTSDGDNEDA